MSIFNFIKSRLSILDVINEYVTVKKAGTYWKGPCPFHHEKTGSFTVSPEKEIFYCFGCHASGDLISFVARMENCSPLEAVQFLAERYGLELPQSEEFSSPKESRDKKDHYFFISSKVARWCHELLLKSPTALTYLTNRGFTEKTIQRFQIGYMPSGLAGIKTFVTQMNQLNILVSDLLQAHILAEGKKILYSPFEDRLIFPISDAMGRCCGFGGRIFRPADTRPKYYNSRENEHFAKGTLLFGLNHAKKAIQEQSSVFLVEGYTDCIAMVQHGYENTVATLGTACTPAHLKLLSRYADHLYVLYDGDSAGQQAILRLTSLCWQVNMELKVVCLPTGQDPASFLKSGNDLQALIEKAKDIFIFFVDSMSSNFTNKTLHEKVTVTRKVVGIIRTIEDPLKQDILLQQASHAFEIPFESLQKELHSVNDQPSKKEAPIALSEHKSIPNESATDLEKKIFCAIVNNVQLFNAQAAKYLITYMPDPLRAILKKLQSLKQQQSNLSFADFFDTLEANEKHYISKLLLEREESITNTTFDQLLRELQKKQWKVIVHDVKNKLAYAKSSGNEEMVRTLLHDFMELKRAMIQPVVHEQGDQAKKVTENYD